MRQFFLYFIALGFTFIAPAQSDSNSMDNRTMGSGIFIKVLAKIGKNTISSYDVDQRLRLVAFMSSQSYAQFNTAENRKKILKDLIEEVYKKELFKNIKASLSKHALDDHVANLEKQNGLKPGQLYQNLQSQNIAPSDFKDFMQTQMLWSSYAHERYGRGVKVAPHEIAQEKSAILKKVDLTFYQLYEIVVPTKKQAELIVQKMNQGVAFKALVQEFSQAPSRSQEGIISARPLAMFDGPRQNLLKSKAPDTLFGPVSLDSSQWIVGMFAKFTMDKKNFKLPSDREIEHGIRQRKEDALATDSLRAFRQFMPCHVQ